MLSAAQQAEVFLINVIFDLYLMILMLRFVLCWVGANYFNPITQIVVKLTNPVVSPLRRIIPVYKNLELPTLILIILIAALKYLLICIFTVGVPNNFLGLFVLSIADGLKILLNLFFYAILLQAILTWINQGFSPLAQLLSQLTSPLMRPIRKVVPPVGGIDISPIPALILLQLLSILLITPAMTAGWSLTFG